MILAAAALDNAGYGFLQDTSCLKSQWVEISWMTAARFCTAAIDQDVRVSV